MEIKKIDLNDWYEFGAGYTATSYYKHGDDSVMMKLYNENVPKEVLVKEITSAEAVKNLGIPVPDPGYMVECNGQYGIVFERIKGKRSFARIIADESDRLEEMARRLARVCKLIGSKHVDKSLFPNIKDKYSIIFRSDLFTDSEKVKLKAFLDSVPDTDNCIHGDFHMGNVLLTEDGREIVIDLTDVSYGYPLFDVGMMYFACVPGKDEIQYNLYHFHKDKAIPVWKNFASEYFGVSTEEELAKIEEQVKPYAGIRMAELYALSGSSDVDKSMYMDWFSKY